MSRPTPSDLMSTVATHLNIVIVALRLLADMIQSPEDRSPTVLAPTSCPSRPSPTRTSPLLLTTDYLSFYHLGTLRISRTSSTPPATTISGRLQGPPLSPTSSAGSDTPPTPPISLPPSFLSSTPFSSSPLPFPCPLSPRLLPALSPPGFAYPHPSACASHPSPSPSNSLVSSAPLVPPIPSRTPSFSCLTFLPPLLSSPTL